MMHDYNYPNDFNKYFPNRNENKKNDIYDMFISKDETVIYKKHKNNPSKLKHLLEDEIKKIEFQGILSGTGIFQDLRPHVVRGFNFEQNGSYKSEFIHGYRLDLVEFEKLTTELSEEIIDQSKKLLQNMELANLTNELFGDWALHNLIYSIKYKRIINIDLEGFMTYNPLPEWANFEIIYDWITSIMVPKPNLQNRNE